MTQVSADQVPTIGIFMSTVTHTEFLRLRIDDEIRRLIAQAVRTGSVISSAREAERLAALYGPCGQSAEGISEEIIKAGICAGVAIEMCRPRARTGVNRVMPTKPTESQEAPAQPSSPGA
jgi:hypothetical protein